MPRQKQELPRRSQLEAVASTVRGAFSTVEEMTESFIREAILQGVLRPGDRLQQDEIAAVLGVSRMPVRASLRQLEAEGEETLRLQLAQTRPDRLRSPSSTSCASCSRGISSASRSST